MAPIKKGGKGNGSILSYFTNHIIPPNRWVNNDTPAEEIVVAPRAAAPTSSKLPNAAGARSESQASASATPQKKRGRPPESSSPTNSLPRSSQSSSSNASNASRKRGRPKKTESQQMRDDQLRFSSSAIPPSKPSTPRKSPTQYNINPLDGVANITPTKDLPFRSPSCTPAKVRVASIVEISSSPSSGPHSSAMELGMALAPPSNNIISPSKINNALSNTFGTRSDNIFTPPTPPAASLPSISTLTSVPSSSVLSGVPASTASSRRVTTKSGLQAVKDSDSEDESASEDELPSVTSFVKPLPSKSAEPTSKRVKLSPPEDRTKESSKSLSLKYRADKAKLKSPPRPKFRNSLADLVAEQEQMHMSRATVESLEDSVRLAKQQEEEEKQLAEENIAINPEFLRDVAGGDSDDQERMIKALQRTEALQDEQRFYFFLDAEPKTTSDTPFPDLSNEIWAKLYSTESSRSHACRSGFAAEVASQYPLPSQVTHWMMEQLCYEPDESLCEAYVEIIKASLVHENSVSDTWNSFNSIYRTRSLFSMGMTGRVKSGLPAGLLHILRVVSRLAPRRDNERPDAVPLATCEAFTDLALMNVDEHVRTNAALREEIAAATETLLDALTDDLFDKFVTDAVTLFFSPSDLPPWALYRAIVSLPASTARADSIRRRLALECFSTAADRKKSDGQDWAKSIVTKLESKPEFQMSASTDYRLLADLLDVLDIAISGGWTDFAQLTIQEPVGAWGSLPPPSQAEQQHNLQIDKICKPLHAILSKIQNAGTSHLRRTEARTSAERIVVRLEQLVRARPKPKKGVFGFHDDEPVYQRSFKQATFGNNGFIKKETPKEMKAEAPVSKAAVKVKSPVKVEKPTVSFSSSPPVPTKSKTVLAKQPVQDDPSDSDLSSVEESIYHTTIMDVDDKADDDDDEQGSTIHVSTPKPRTYCYCEGADEDRMLACDSSTCERQWFHSRCLGIDRPPAKEKWYCDECKEKEGIGADA